MKEQERIQIIKSYIDYYLDCAKKETDVIKKDSWTELAAHWSQYLKSISGIKYREKECNIFPNKFSETVLTLE